MLLVLHTMSFTKTFVSLKWKNMTGTKSVQYTYINTISAINLQHHTHPCQS